MNCERRGGARAAAWALGLAAATWAGGGEGRAAQRALLVGLNYGEPGAVGGPGIRPLRGCLNDVESVRALLVGQLGFAAGEVLVLREQEATRNGIAEAFRSHLVSQTSPGDTAVFYYSGHGTQAPDLDADEDDGRDEALVPWDTLDASGRATGLLLDDDLKRLSAQMSGRNLIFIIDACHSGTIHKGSIVAEPPPGARRFVNPEAERIRERGTDRGGMARDLSAAEGSGPGQLWTLVAATDAQDAWEDQDAGVPRGVFTTALVELLTAATKPAKARSLLEDVQRLTRQRARVLQTPQMHVVGGDLEAAFPLAVMGGAHPAASSVPKLRVRLDGGLSDEFRHAVEGLAFLDVVTADPDRVVGPATRTDGRDLALVPTPGAAMASGPSGAFIALASGRVLQRFDASASAGLAAALERECALEALVRLQPAQPAFDVQLTAGAVGAPLPTGSEIPFRLRVSPRGEGVGEPCAHVTLLGVSSDGELFVLVPLPPPAARRVPRSVAVPANLSIPLDRTIPLPPTPTDACGEAARATALAGPIIRVGPGREYYKVIVTSRPLDTGHLALRTLEEAFRQQSGVAGLSGSRDLAADVAPGLERLDVGWGTAGLFLEGR